MEYLQKEFPEIQVPQLSEEINKLIEQGHVRYIDSVYQLTDSGVTYAKEIYLTKPKDTWNEHLLKVEASIAYQKYCKLAYEMDVSILPDESILAKALIKEQIAYEFTNFSKEEKQLWLRCVKVVEGLKEDFIAEGNERMYESRQKETSFMLERIENNCSSRFLYHVKF